MSSFFAPRKSSSSNDPPEDVHIPKQLPPSFKILPLTQTQSSWVVHVPKFCPPPSPKNFREFWKHHPTKRHSLLLFGKAVQENRYSQMYSVVSAQASTNGLSHYKYSGTTRPCLPCDPEQRDEKFIMDLCSAADQFIPRIKDTNGTTLAPARIPANGQQENEEEIYNCCLVNWYTPDHTIGLHSDDEPEMDTSWPILSLSWGGPRRFLLRPKSPAIQSVQAVHEFWLKDGDLFIMGGKCQDEFKHEIPKVRTTKDGVVGNRIGWTLRRMKRVCKKMISPSEAKDRKSVV